VVALGNQAPIKVRGQPRQQQAERPFPARQAPAGGLGQARRRTPCFLQEPRTPTIHFLEQAAVPKDLPLGRSKNAVPPPGPRVNHPR